MVLCLLTSCVCVVPPTLFGGQGCLHKGLVKRIGVVEISPKSADTIIIDVSKLFYHIIRQHVGSQSELVAYIEERLSKYPEATKKIVAFDSYQDISVKDRERMRRASQIVIGYDLSIASHLTKKDAIMKLNQINETLPVS